MIETVVWDAGLEQLKRLELLELWNWRQSDRFATVAWATCWLASDSQLWDMMGMFKSNLAKEGR
jgi:hypothetical protein